ncbi:MAG: response regulator transcription factor [Bacteroidota bacterium]
MNSEGLNILIIEDELLIAQNIQANLQQLGYQAESFSENTDHLTETIELSLFDLAVVDIGLKGTKNGIVIAQEIRQKVNIPIIFLTSHQEEEMILKAAEAGPAAYLLKPYHISQLVASIQVAIRNYALAENADPSGDIDPQQEDQFIISDSIFIREKSRFIRVNYNKILWLEAKSNYTEIVTQNQKYLLSVTLKNLSEKINHISFIRIHRSHMINLDFITGFEGNTVFIGEKKFPVSQQYRENFFKKFNII